MTSKTSDKADKVPGVGDIAIEAIRAGDGHADERGRALLDDAVEDTAVVASDIQRGCAVSRLADEADVQALSPLEAKALRKYLRPRVDTRRFLFITERGSQFSRQGVHRMVKAMGRHAGLGSVHPHRLRHACGYHLVNQGEPMRFIQSYMGHKTEAMTLLYTQLSARKYDSIRTHFK